MIDYNSYSLTKKQYILVLLCGGCLFFLIGYIFFMNVYLSILLSIFTFFIPKFRARKLRDKRKQELVLQFKQALVSLSSSLSSGRSMERALEYTLEDLRKVYSNENTYIVQEFKIMNAQIKNGVSVENVFQNFRQRAGIEEITSFVEVFKICKRSGGNLVEVIRTTTNMISDKIEISQEIQVLISNKKFETRILNIIPFIFIAVLRYSSPEYMSPLYHGKGLFIMFIALSLLILSFVISQWLMNIQV
ncbi:type II secretion system F family protein [Chengkuizengella axinellae]|uniref:Type II secretion system F family protein n=1 Tax=Chengkuizengella axinellae TaxID=3064388 RepID=A0ABT9IXM0_9BACL|nr:type II secretion system F family protein [Chengkuizengella sp. 2205SS18-9]MDP5274096.1 type II secretion system F family protein [Chengkuizengella sp. 2205SS18-9]